MHSSRMRTGHSLTVCWCLLPRGGVSAPGGMSAPGGVSAPGGCLLRGVGGVCSRGVSALGGLLLGVCSGGCLLPGSVCSGGVWSRGSGPGGVCSGGVCFQWGVGVVSQHALRQTPSPRGQNHRHL